LKLLIPVLFFTSTLFSQNFTWTVLPLPTTKTVYSIDFRDSLYGFAAGDSGLVLKTTDGGHSWQDISVSRNLTISDITFTSKTTGFAVGIDFETPPFGTLFFKTTNGGDTWVESRYREDEAYMLALHFLDSLNGWTSGLEGKIAYTTDGGSEWHPALNDTAEFTNFPVLGFSFYTDSLAFAFGGHIDIAGVIWRTTDGGQYWKSHGVGPEPIKGIIVFDSLNLLGIGGDFEYGTAVVRSTDSGLTWDYRSLDIFGVPFGLSFRNETEVWTALGFAEKFIYSTDTGQNWTEVATPDSGVVYDIQFTDSVTGYTAGRLGYFAKYSRTTVGIEDSDLPVLPVNHSLGQNYPNPFNPATKIPVELSEAATIKLTIYDMRGREVREIAAGNFDAGNHLFSFQSEGIPSGIYLYRLEITGQSNKKESIVRKMVLLK